MLKHALSYLENLYNSRRLTTIGSVNLLNQFLQCKSEYDVVELAYHYRRAILD